MQAIRHGSVKQVEEAINNGADVALFQHKGKSLLRLAGELGHKEICHRLVIAGLDPNEAGGAKNYSLLHNATASKNYGFAASLLDLGANPSPTAVDGSTPLHLAARTGQEYLADRLLKHGAVIDARDNQGRTPIILAVEKGELSLTKLLLKRGCDANAVDKKQRTPLMLAAAHQQDEIKALLIEYGATQDAPAKSDWRKNAEALTPSPNQRSK